MPDIEHLIDLVPQDVLGICRRLREKGKRGWIVGGCVRDLLRGQPAKDWDVATDARPEEIIHIFRKVIPTGIQHGTVTVVLKGIHYEVTTLRGEGAYSDGRRPDKVEFVDDITADLARRDFTFNAIAIDPVDGHLIDPFGGRRDLDARVVRAVGDPGERFAEDGLRVLRAARFAATLECSIDPETERAMASARSHETFRRVSAERVREEWLKAMIARRPSVAFEVMRRTDILSITCPELLAAARAPDPWGHTMACLDACRPDPTLRMAALMHVVEVEVVDAVLSRLRFSNEQRAKIVALVRHHLICYSDDWTDAAVRRWLRRITPALAPDLYELGVADALGKGRDAGEDVAAIGRLKARGEALLAAGAALSTRDLAINGSALMKELGLTPGPLIGEILERLVELVTDEPAANTPERLLAAARDVVRTRGAVRAERGD
jgi:tRNA nucleotidyltransferase (CCA-adding enzyme)